MKIGLVCPYNIFKGGGVQKVVLGLRSGLEKRGLEAQIITPKPKDFNSRAPKGIHFIGTSADFKSPLHTTAQVSVSFDRQSVEILLGTERFDILHFHEPWVPMVSRQLLTRSDAINLATFHAALPQTAMSRTIERVVVPYTRSIMKYLDGLSAVSDTAAAYARMLIEKPVLIIPNGVNLRTYRPLASDHPSTKATATIFYLGRLEKRKGVKYLVKAYAKLTEKYPKLELLIAGEGPDRHKLKMDVRDLEVPRVSFLGHVSEQKKIALFHMADLLCVPSLFGESFGIILLEAMATGTVTVAGNNPGYLALMKDRGVLSIVNPKDSEELARRLELLLFDAELRTAWRQWAQVYVKQFDEEKVVDQYLDWYKMHFKLGKGKRKARVRLKKAPGDLAK